MTPGTAEPPETGWTGNVEVGGTVAMAVGAGVGAVVGGGVGLALGDGLGAGAARLTPIWPRTSPPGLAAVWMLKYVFPA